MKPYMRVKQNLYKNANCNSQTSLIQTMMSVVVGNSSLLSSDDNLEKGIELCTPVAFVISTETEYHDIFRDILIEMFNSIRDPENVSNSIGS